MGVGAEIHEDNDGRGERKGEGGGRRMGRRQAEKGGGGERGSFNVQGLGFRFNFIYSYLLLALGAVRLALH